MVQGQVGRREPRRQRRTSAATVVTYILLALCLTGRAAETTPTELAQALQRKLDGIKDFSTDFVHTYQGGVLRKTITERGRLLVKKPGKMRWEYTKPEEKLFVSDGVKMYSYLPQDKQVMVTSVPSEGEATTPPSFWRARPTSPGTSRPLSASFPSARPGGRAPSSWRPKLRNGTTIG
jgi:hypothetical protein